MIRELLLLLFAAPLAGPAPQSSDPAPAGALAPGAPVLRLDGEEITAAEYAHWLLDNFGARQARTFAVDHLVEREAERRGVDVSPEEVARELEAELATRIEGAFLGRKEGWLAELERTQRTEAGIRAQRTQALRIELLAKKSVAVDRVIPEEKIRREWELSYGRGGRAYGLSMLFVRSIFHTREEETTIEERARARQAVIDAGRERALALRARVVGGEDFAAVARAASDDEASRAAGGKPPQGFRHFGWPQTFLDALDLLAPGEISQPIYGRGGWWILRVDELRVTPLEDVREELVRRLVARGPGQDETGLFRNALLEAARVEVLPTLFGEPPAGYERPELVPGLRIDGEAISRGTYANWIRSTRGEASWPHFVEHRVVVDEARRRGIEVQPAEVRARAEDHVRKLILRDHKGSRESWLAQIQARGRDESSFLRDLEVRMRIDLLTERLLLMDREVTPEQVRLRFDDVYGKDGQMVQARMILLNVPIRPAGAQDSREELEARITAAKEATRERAQALAMTVREGGDFASLARQHSEDSASAARGGMLDVRFRPERWPEAISKLVEGLEVGGVTDAMEFGPSFVVLQVVSRERIDFETVKDDLREQLQLEPPPLADLSMYRNVLVKKAKVEILEGMNR